MLRSVHLPAGVGLTWLVALASCVGPAPGPAPLFSEDYATTYVEVRSCRRSPEHDLAYIRVLASPDAASVYLARSDTFPPGAVIVKEEHADPGCSDLIRWTAMRREREGYFPAGGDYRWQRVALSRAVEEDGQLRRCADCHTACSAFELTCTEP